MDTPYTLLCLQKIGLETSTIEPGKKTDEQSKSEALDRDAERVCVISIVLSTMDAKVNECCSLVLCIASVERARATQVTVYNKAQPSFKFAVSVSQHAALFVLYFSSSCFSVQHTRIP